MQIQKTTKIANVFFCCSAQQNSKSINLITLSHFAQIYCPLSKHICSQCAASNLSARLQPHFNICTLHARPSAAKVFLTSQYTLFSREKSVRGAIKTAGVTMFYYLPGAVAAQTKRRGR